ncbi:putative 2-oxo-4-hydroxy-4-carboxy-5-ureidoimidazoline decarboxylase [Rhynchocyon petersi]
MDLKKVNSMDFGDFVDMFGNVIERCPLIAAAVWSQRPFRDLNDLEKRFSDFIDALPQSGQEGILRCHPDLAGRELQRGALSAESLREQSAAGLRSLGADARRRLGELNAQYRARFGFPFVLAARLRDPDAVERELLSRLQNPPALELSTALREVKTIGRLRLADLLVFPCKEKPEGALGRSRAPLGLQTRLSPALVRKHKGETQCTPDGGTIKRKPFHAHPGGPWLAKPQVISDQTETCPGVRRTRETSLNGSCHRLSSQSAQTAVRPASVRGEKRSVPVPE